MGELGSMFYLAAVLFVIVLAICWIVLPFALIGTKPLLREIRDELRKLNASRKPQPPAPDNRSAEMYAEARRRSGLPPT